MSGRNQEIEELGVPQGWKVFSSFPFAGMHNAASRVGIADQEFYWLENYLKVGDGHLRAVLDIGTALYTAPDSKTILSVFFYNIGTSQYAIVFLTDGTAYQVSYPAGTVTQLPNGSVSFQPNGGNKPPACCQWGSQYLLIANNHDPNAYWLWDGSHLFTAGTLGPLVTIEYDGLGYTSPPTISTYGGLGSGATFSSTVSDGLIQTITVTNPGVGYEVGDTVGLEFTGGGSDTTAVMLPVMSGDGIASVDIIEGGTGYTNAPGVGFVPRDGHVTSPAFAYATVSNGSVASVTVYLDGSGYTADPTVFIPPPTGTGTQAAAHSLLTPTTVESVTLTSGGSGYTAAPTVAIQGGNGTGATAYCIVTGAVTNLFLTNGGTGYTSAPTVTLSGGGGTGATATAVLSGTSVAGLVLTSGGSGYTSAPTVTFSGGGGAGASAYSVVTGNVVSQLILTNGGSGYTQLPTISFVGVGSGASATLQLTPTGVASVVVDNGGSGYQPTPKIQVIGVGTGASVIAFANAGSIYTTFVANPGTGYTSPPLLQVEAGNNKAAVATATLMPFGVSGTSMETFDGRVFIVDPYQQGVQPSGGDILVSAPGSLSDFATSDGGDLFTSSDRFLRTTYTAIRQSNGYLYPLGDSSASVISNVQTSGTPPTTTFNYQNTDPQVGATWRDSVQDFSRTILFANPIGVYGLYGGAVTKISKKMDDVINDAIFPPAAGAVTPCAAVANIYGIKCYMILMTIQDRINGGQRNALLMWDEKEWYILSQSATLQYICTQEVASNLTAWGTDRKSLFPLFAKQSETLVKIAQTKLFGAQQPWMAKESFAVLLQTTTDYQLLPVTMNVTLDTEMISVPLASATVQPPASVPPQQLAVTYFDTQNTVGMNLGVTIKSTSPYYELANILMGYYDAGFSTGSINAEVSYGQ